MPDDFVDFFWQSADGLRLHARDYSAAAERGSRPPVVCLHGLTRNARDFETLAPWLASRGHRVLAADARGRGLSAWDAARRYVVPAYVEDVRALLAATGLSRAIFLGTSMGGLTTMLLAALHPALVAGAIINDVGPELGERGLVRILGLVGSSMIVSGWEEAAALLRSRNEAILPRHGPADWMAMAWRNFRVCDGQVVADYDPAIGTPAEVHRPTIGPWEQWDALIAASPVLLLRGALSDLLEPEIALAMTLERARVSFAEIPDVGHTPTLDEPIARDAIAAFLDRLPG